jgi:cation:H+ antiporter
VPFAPGAEADSEGDKTDLLPQLSRMPLPLAILSIVAGIAVLAYGADLLVRGAVTIATAARVSAAVIGLTIVSMGTSLPELTVSVAAALRGSADLGIGNVVGSNIFNIGIVLGVTALILPMRVHSSAVRLEWPFMFLASFQLLLLARDGEIDRLEGGFFLVAIVLFTWYAVMIGREAVGVEESADLAEEVQRRAPKADVRTTGTALGLVAIGIGLLVLGGELLVRGAVELARAAGMTERVIGLTIVAAGTGTPEVATSIVAARRGQSEIALGNVIGSNIFNILGILGISALLTPLAVAPEMIRSDFWWMLGLSLVLFPMMRSKAVVSRVEGGVLVLAYVAYLGLLALGA